MALVLIVDDDVSITTSVALLLKQAGHEVRLVDARLEPDAERMFTEFRPEAVGITGFTTHLNIVKHLAARLKNRDPKVLIVVGGGVIALELGQMYLRLGCEVTVLEHGPRILPLVEAEPALALRQALVSEGMRVEEKATVCSVRREDELIVVDAETGGHRQLFSAEKLLLAVGTAPGSTASSRISICTT